MLPNMATTSSSWITSREPETIKHRLSMLSPVWYIRSPGAEWVMAKCIARARRQPSLARRNAGCSLNTFLFRCTQISAFISFGQKSSTYNDDSQILYGTSFLIGFFTRLRNSYSCADLRNIPYLDPVLLSSPRSKRRNPWPFLKVLWVLREVS